MILKHDQKNEQLGKIMFMYIYIYIKQELITHYLSLHFQQKKTYTFFLKTIMFLCNLELEKKFKLTF